MPTGLDWASPIASAMRVERLTGFHEPPTQPTIATSAPAAAAGIQPGDTLVAVDGVPVTSFEQASAIIQDNPDRTIPLVVERDGAEVALQITPMPAQREVLGDDGEVTVAEVGFVGMTAAYEYVREPIWEGPRARSLRAALARGDLGYGCSVCRHRLEHSAGGMPIDLYDLYPLADPAVTPEWPALLSFSLHNTCNLACIMCGGDASSKIRTQRDGLPGLPHAYGDAFFEQIANGLGQFAPH